MTTALSLPTRLLEKIPPVTKVSCDLCGEGKYEVLIEGRWSLVRCGGCGLVFLHPQPSPEQFEQVYDASYYTNKPAPTQSRVSLSQRIREKVLQACWGYPTPHGRRAGLPFRLLFSPLRYRVMPVAFSPDAWILDVGCGNGQRLAELARYGHSHLHGVEPSPPAAQLARAACGATIHEGTLEDADLPTARFDLLVMNQVLEHLPRPSQTLREARRVLRPGGLLYLTVPNYGSMESRVFGKNWDALKIPEHLHHYTRATLLRLLDDSGFEIRMCRTDSISAVTLASIRNWSASRAPWCRRWARVFASVIQPAVMLCDVLGQGSILRVLAKRP